MARLRTGLWVALLGGLLMAVVGVAGLLAGDTPLGGSWLTAALGPTAYVMLAHPRDAQSRWRNGAVGHAVGVIAGLVALAMFGLWDAPSVVETHHETIAQIAAQAVALALTLVVLTLTGVHHVPAAASTLLVASGVAAPGMPLIGLVLGLVVVLSIAALFVRLTVGHPSAATSEERGTPAR